MENNTFRIHIKIDNRTYPLDINRADEEMYRQAAKLVNETVVKYRKLFPDNDSKDILAMTSFQIALEVAELQNREDRSLFMDELRNLNDDISDFLNERNKK